MAVSANRPAEAGLQTVPMPALRGGPAAAAGACDALDGEPGAFDEALDSSIATTTDGKPSSNDDDPGAVAVPVPIDAPIPAEWRVAPGVPPDIAAAAEAGDAKKPPRSTADLDEDASTSGRDGGRETAESSANVEGANAGSALDVAAPARATTAGGSAAEGKDGRAPENERGGVSKTVASPSDRTTARPALEGRSAHASPRPDPAAAEAPGTERAQGVPADEAPQAGERPPQPASPRLSAARAGAAIATGIAHPAPAAPASAAHAAIDFSHAPPGSPARAAENPAARSGAPAIIAAQESAATAPQVGSDTAPSAAARAGDDADAVAASDRQSAFNGFDQSSHPGAQDRPPHERAPDAPATGRVPSVTLVAAPDGTLRLTGSVPVESAAPHATADEHAENLGRLIQTFRVQLKDGISEATIRLRPEHLGEVTVAVKVEGKAVSAVVHAESASVREWLQAQESSIRGSLVEQGLHLERLHVQRDPQHERRERQMAHRPRPRSRQQSGEPRFEIVV